MAKRVIKINTNPSSKTKIATSSPSAEAQREWSEWNRDRLKRSAKPVQKIITSTWTQSPTTKQVISAMSRAKGGSTRIGNLSGGLGGIMGKLRK